MKKPAAPKRDDLWQPRSELEKRVWKRWSEAVIGRGERARPSSDLLEAPEWLWTKEKIRKLKHVDKIVAQPELVRWTNARLDEIFDRRSEEHWRKAHSKESLREYEKWLFGFGKLLDSADQGGDLKLLLQRLRASSGILPRLANIIERLGKKKKTKKKTTTEETDEEQLDKRKALPSAYDLRLDAAAADAYVIRQIWKRELGRKNRPNDDWVTAQKIAAARWEVDVAGVDRRMKKIPAKRPLKSVS